MQTKHGSRLKISIIISIIVIPLILVFEHMIFNGRQYYFISTVMICLSFIPFLISFEGKSPKIRELVMIAVLISIAVASRSAFFMLPQFKPVLAIVVISAMALGGEVGFLIGMMTSFVSNFFFGQGPWTVWQMFALGMVGLIAGILFKYIPKNKLNASIYGSLSVFLIHGVIMNFSSMIMSTGDISLDTYLLFLSSGFPFDIIYAISTIFYMFILYKPMMEKIQRVCNKYGLINGGNYEKKS